MKPFFVQVSFICGARRTLLLRIHVQLEARLKINDENEVDLFNSDSAFLSNVRIHSTS